MAAAMYYLIESVFGEDSSEDEEYERPQKSEPLDGFSLSEREFKKLFRLKKATARKLCNELRSHLQAKSEVKTALSVERKVLCALRFYGTGAYQKTLSQDRCVLMSQQSVSKCIASVSKAIDDCLLAKYVTFPDVSEYSDLQEKFYSRHRFPGVIGAVDCTHIAIEAPSMFDEEYPESIYINRKLYHSINTQLVCDADLRILNINARYPGRTHDSFIWKGSALRERLVQESFSAGPSGWLLGDSGYPLEPWLMTPFTTPQTAAERNYNTSHAKARSVIERCNGVLKSRFRCLSRHRTLKYHPVMAARITNACAVLHNLCLDENDHMKETRLHHDDEIPPPCEGGESLRAAPRHRRGAKMLRQRLVNTHFTQR